jgi:hypothetical protein
MIETKTVNKCVSVGDLTFVLGEDHYRGLGSVSFTVTQDVISGVTARRDCIGMFGPKDEESAFKLEEAFNERRSMEIRGSFMDTLSDNKEADWKLANVSFGQFRVGGISGGNFRAIPSEYPLGTFTGE